MRKGSPTSKTRPGRSAKRDIEAPDQRVVRSRRTILDATTQLLSERGLSGATVDEISRRSGVAKTTIYRHWPTRIDLLRDACSKLGTPLEAPDAGNFEGDAIALTSKLARMLRSAQWTSVLPSIIDAAEREPDIADMYSRLQQGYSAPFEAIIRRALRKGELPANTDAATLIAALTGPLFYRRWFSREPLTDAFAKRIVRLAIGGAVPRGGSNHKPQMI
ncbi:MAG: TetR/AcrR family transcriptional regulator [Bradyrhizobium sp.]|nr:MAG: TetR/AcrR family transcriptional regulator [Bradyrhizobium sp.]